MAIEEDEQYKLFCNSHYRVEIKQSYRPIWSSSSMHFPSKTCIIKRRLSILDKLIYYWRDLSLWLKERKRE